MEYQTGKDKQHYNYLIFQITTASYLCVDKSHFRDPQSSGPIFSYKLRYIVGFGLVEMAISTNPKPTIYRNLYENTGPGNQ